MLLHATTTWGSLGRGCVVTRSLGPQPLKPLSLDLLLHRDALVLFGQEASSSVGECRIVRVRSDQP